MLPLPRSWRRSIQSFLATGVLALGSLQAIAADFTVTNTNDSGTGSLRNAIDQANLSAGSNTITIATTGTITLASALSPIATNVSINGPGAASLTIDGANTTRIFYVESGTVSISRITLANGLAQGGNGGTGLAGGGGGLGAGGALFVAEQANVTIQSVAIANNHALGGSGGGASVTFLAGGGGGGLGGAGGNFGGGGGGYQGNGGSNSGGGGGQFAAGGTRGGGGGGQRGMGGDGGGSAGGGGGGGAQGNGGTNSGGGGGQFGNGGNNVGGGGGQFGNGGSNVGGGGGQMGNGGNNTGGGGGSVTNGGDGNGFGMAGAGGTLNGGAGAGMGPAANGGPNGGGGGGGNPNGSVLQPGNGGNGGVNGGGGGGNVNGGNGGVNGGGGGGNGFFSTNSGGAGGANGGGGGGSGNGGNGGANGGGGGAFFGNGGNGGANGGGGGVSGSGNGGNGGANGGGGGSGNSGNGGNGGANGGGGGSATGPGGTGGFGAGGGGGGNAAGDAPLIPAPGGAAGFGGGNGGQGGSPGNGGSALGGAIFVKQGGTLTIIDGSLSGSGVTAGAGMANGNIAGAGIYLYNADAIFQTNATTTIADEIAGTGGLAKSGAGALFLTASNTYTGPTTVNQGALTVNGQIVSAVLVNAGGTLSGIGQVGATTVNGIIAPGNPTAPLNFNGVHVQSPPPNGTSASTIGTLTINGSYVQNTGSTYQVKINAAGQSDLIQVNGKAQINGGIIQVLAFNGAYQQNQAFTILNATGGVSGTYKGTTGVVPGFFTITPLYSANSIAIAISSSYQSVATSFNQLSLARYLDSQSAAGTLPPILESQLRSLSPDQLGNALNQLAGSPYASLLTVGRLRSLFLNQLFVDQIRPNNLFGATSTVRGQMAPLDDSDEHGSGLCSGLRGWSRLYGLDGRVTDDNNLDGFRYSFSGFQMGVEKQLFETTRFGLTGSYSYTSVDFNQLTSTASGSGGLVGIYGVQSLGNAYLLAAGTYGFNQFSVDRYIAFGTLNTVATSNPHQDEFNGLFEAGYNQQCGAWFLQPMIGLQDLTLHQSSVVERANSGVGLNIAGQSTNALWFSTGLRLSRPIQDGNSQIVPTFHTRWVQDWQGEDHFVSGALSGAGGSYLVQGATAGRNYLVTGLTVAADTGSFFRLVADYTFQTTGKQSSHTGSGGVELRW